MNFDPIYSSLVALAALPVHMRNSSEIVSYVYWYNRSDQYLYSSTLSGTVEQVVRWNAAPEAGVVKIFGHMRVSPSSK